MSLKAEERHLGSMQLKKVIGKDNFPPKKLAKVIFKKYYGTLQCLQGEIDSFIKFLQWYVY